MKSLLQNITSNILLIIAGLLSCLLHNWFLGLLIGAGAGILNCIFRGSLKAGGWKDTLIVAAPASIIIGVLCAFGAGMCNNSIVIFNILITVAVIILCGVLGSFMGNSKFYSEKEQPAVQHDTPTTPTPTNIPATPSNDSIAPPPIPNAPNDAASVIANLRNRRKGITEQVEDKIIDTDGRDKIYYDAIKKLTGKDVVTESSVMDAYRNLPDDVKQMYSGDPPNVAIMSYAYSQLLSTTQEVNDPYSRKVMELSGMHEVTEASVEKAYNSLSDDIRRDLPKDPVAAIMLLAHGKTLKTIINEESERDAQQRLEEEREIENCYALIPSRMRAWLPANHKEAVAMYKAGKYLDFYSTLPDNLKYNIPKYVIDFLAPDKITDPDERNEWLHINRAVVLDKFCEEFPEPLCYIPTSVLVRMVPTQFCFANDDKMIVSENIDALKAMFDNSLGEPLRRIPIKCLWLALEARERQMPEFKVRDIKTNIDKLRQVFDIDVEPCKCMLHTMLPSTLRKWSEVEMYGMIGKCDKVWLSIFNNIDLFKKYESGESVTVEEDSVVETSYFMRVAPYSMLRYMIEFCTDVTKDSDMSDKDFWLKYRSYYEKEVIFKDLPGVLSQIPLPMIQFLVEDPEDLNLEGMSDVAALYTYAMRNSSSLLRLFDKGHVIPTMCLGSWKYSEQDLVKRHGENEEIDESELWRLWLPPELYDVSYDKLADCSPGYEDSKNPDLHILQHTTNIYNILSRADRGKK